MKSLRNQSALFRIQDNKILPHFPKHPENIAEQTGVLKRKRDIRSVQDLLKILFIYFCYKFSFRIPAAAYALGISNISDTVWRKRFSNAVTFLHELLHQMLSNIFTPSAVFCNKFKNVLLVDTSVIRQKGAKQEQQRIHLCYSLNQNRMKQVK